MMLKRFLLTLLLPSSLSSPSFHLGPLNGEYSLEEPGGGRKRREGGATNY